jgi:hypothetical protein
MELTKAIKTLEVLADGVNPLTGEVFQREAPYNDPIVIRSLFTVLESIKAIKPRRKTPAERQQDNIKNGRPKNAGLPWTDELRTDMAAKFQKGKSVDKLAADFERTTGAITSELVRQGLVDATAVTRNR